MILRPDFYERSTLKVARDLLGSFLIRDFSRAPGKPGRAGTGENGLIRARITETEAYHGPRDLASHASRGRTKRNEVMFGPPGMIYVYFIYGWHYMLNIVTGPPGFPGAVLIRAAAIAGPGGNDAIKTNGPGKLTRSLGIDRVFNGLPVYEKKYGLWIEGRMDNGLGRIKRAPRVGVEYAGKYREKLWRFYLASE